jgi:hypothetical protein
MKKTKETIITFKVDPSLLKEIQGVANRSEFIRGAVLAALENSCPLCKGQGVLTPNQRRHWTHFLSGHSVVECESCHETHLACAVKGSRPGAASAKACAGKVP